jgi:serine-type D-Ala-D-Ala carboxypeptidase (penicillin-binding protein 5/6)
MPRRRPGARAGCLALLALALAAPAAAGLPALRQVTVLRAGQTVARVHLRYRGSSTIGLLAARAVRVALAPGDRPVVTVEEVPTDLTGPEPRGSQVGRAVVRVGGRELAAVSLITQRTVATATLGQRLRDFLLRPLTLVAMAVLVGCSLLLAILRARATRREPARHERTPGSGSAA